jgi:hypothetical protein
MQNRPEKQSKGKGYYKYGRGWNQLSTVKSGNEWLASFTLHQGTKRPGFDPVNVTNQFERMRFGIFFAM